MEETITALDKNQDKSAKSLDFFQDNTLLKRRILPSLTQSQGSGREIFCKIFPIKNIKNTQKCTVQPNEEVLN